VAIETWATKRWSPGRNGICAVIGEITEKDFNLFTYAGDIVATIPNKPTPEQLKGLND
jgi:hypothetical protein